MNSVDKKKRILLLKSEVENSSYYYCNFTSDQFSFFFSNRKIVFFDFGLSQIFRFS